MKPLEQANDKYCAAVAELAVCGYMADSMPEKYRTIKRRAEAVAHAAGLVYAELRQESGVAK